MENKKWLNNGLKQSLFAPCRLVFIADSGLDDGAETSDKPLDVEKAIEDKKTKLSTSTGLAEVKAEIKTEVKKGAKKKETKKKLDTLKKDFSHFPKKPSLKMPEFKKQVQAGGIKDKLFIDTLGLNISRESNQGIEATQWKLTSQPEIKQVHADFDNIGLLDAPNTDFFNQCFFILNEAYSSKNTHFTNTTTKTYFNNPIKFRKEIMLLPANAGFNASDFFSAYDEIVFAKNLVLAQDAQQIASLSNQEGMGRDTIANKAHDFLKSNYDSFTTAVRSKDYATAGMYAVGVWAIYKSLKLSGLFKEGGDGMKYMAYGLAAYCGVKFAENAGYDLLKMAGFRDPDHHVQGTPMEAFYNTLRGSKDKTERQLAKDVDWQIVSRVSEMSLVDLQEFREDANDANGVQFISPHLMPDLFPGLADEYLSIESLGLGENAMSDYTGMSDIKLTPAQKEYKRVGLQLFKIATMMEVVYNNTLKIDDHPGNPYKDWEYEDAIGKGNRDLGKVRHLASAVSAYAPSKSARKLKGDEVKTHLMDEVFAPYESAGVTVVQEPNKFGHYTGSVKGFPVMFVPDGEKGYRVYLMNNYNDSSNAGRKHISGGTIPYEGDAGNAPGVIIKAVEARMDKLLAPLRDASGKKLDSLKYVGGEWVCGVTIKGVKAFGLPDANDKQAKITPDANGKGLSVMLTDGSGVRINLNESMDQQYPIGTALVPHFISDDKFHALEVFSNAKTLRIDNVNEASAPPTFDVHLAGNLDAFEIKYDSSSKVFDFADRDDSGFSVDEKMLLGNPEFANSYIEALNKDELFELTKTTGALVKTIADACPEEHLSYFFQAMFQESNDSPLDGLNLDALTGSVPANFASMIVETSKYEVYQRLRRNIQKADTIEDVQNARKDTINDYLAKLKGIQNKVETHNVSGKDWDRDEFMDLVVDQVRLSSTYSATYAEFKTDVEYMAYKFAPGLLKSSDFSKKSHEVAGKIAGVFAYYTAHLDGEDHKFTLLNDATSLTEPAFSYSKGGPYQKVVNLDSIVFPSSESRMFPVGTFGPGNDHMDPGMRGHYIVNYMDYVKRKMANKLPQIDSSSSIPTGASKKFWEILEFKQWLADPSLSSYEALDMDDNKKPFEHKVKLHETKTHTDFDNYAIGEFRKTVGYLMTKYSGIIKDSELNSFLYDGYLDASGTDYKRNPDGVFAEDQVGFFTPRPILNRTFDPATGVWNEDVVLDSAGHTVYTSPLWEGVTNDIAGSSLPKAKRRRYQIQKVQEKQEAFLLFILTAKIPGTDSLRFFKEPPGPSTWLRKKFPRLYSKLFD